MNHLLRCLPGLLIVNACAAPEKAPMTPAGGQPTERQEPTAASEESPASPAQAVSPAPSKVSLDPELAGEEAAEVDEPQGLPRSCPGEDPVANAVVGAPTHEAPCYPEPAFVEKLCASSYPGAALVMFAKESPWARAYMKGPAKAWATATGAQQEEKLFFREEVLVLHDPAAQDGAVQSSNGASFYALRWNGSCVKLNEEEVTDQPPWQKNTPVLNWGWLDDQVQDALFEQESIKKRVLAMKKACRGARMGDKPPACEGAEKKLTDAIVLFVRDGGQLPDPKHLP